MRLWSTFTKCSTIRLHEENAARTPSDELLVGLDAQPGFDFVFRGEPVESNL